MKIEQKYIPRESRSARLRSRVPTTRGSEDQSSNESSGPRGMPYSVTEDGHFLVDNTLMVKGDVVAFATEGEQEEGALGVLNDLADVDTTGRKHLDVLQFDEPSGKYKSKAISFDGGNVADSRIVIPSLRVHPIQAVEDRQFSNLSVDYDYSLYAAIVDLDPRIVIMRKRRIKQGSRMNYVGAYRKGRSRMWVSLGQYQDNKENNSDKFVPLATIVTNCQLQPTPSWQYVMNGSSALSSKDFALSRIIHNVTKGTLSFSRAKGNKMDMHAGEFYFDNKDFGICVRVNNPSFVIANSDAYRESGIPRYLYGSITPFSIVIEYNNRAGDLIANLRMARFKL